METEVKQPLAVIPAKFSYKHLLVLIPNCQPVLLLLRSDLTHLTCLSFFHLCEDTGSIVPDIQIL